MDADGTAHNIRNGLLTLAYRNDRYAQAVYDYVPGQVVEMEIESLPIVWTVSAGNRIRIDISSSDFPEFSNHTNTVGNWAEQTETKIANQTIYIGGEYPSSVTLPTAFPSPGITEAVFAKIPCPIRSFAGPIRFCTTFSPNTSTPAIFIPQLITSENSSVRFEKRSSGTK